MSAESMEGILKNCGARMGIADWAFNEHGLCHFLVDGDRLFSLYHDVSNGTLVLVGQLLSELPEQVGGPWLELLLSRALNPMTGAGPGVGWDPDLGLTGYWKLNTQGLCVEAFEVELADFIDWISTLSLQLAALDKPFGVRDRQVLI